MQFKEIWESNVILKRKKKIEEERVGGVMVKFMIGIEADSALGNDTVIIIKSWAHS